MPVFFAVYFALRGRKARNVWTLVASLFFYAWGEPVYILLMLASIACNWAFALAIGRTGGTVHAKKPTPPPEAIIRDRMQLIAQARRLRPRRSA